MEDGDGGWRMEDGGWRQGKEDRKWLKSESRFGAIIETK